MIHIARTPGDDTTACGQSIPDGKTNQWGTRLATDEGPVTIWKECVTCEQCATSYVGAGAAMYFDPQRVRLIVMLENGQEAGFPQ